MLDKLSHTLWNTKFKKYGKDSIKSLKICILRLWINIWNLLKKGNHDMLYIGCSRNMATEIFKALHGSTSIYIRDLFEEKDKIYNLCSTVSLKQPKYNTVTYGLNSFR